MSRKPKFEALVVNAIRRLQSAQGSTANEIAHFLNQEYEVSGPEIRRQIQLTIKRGLNYGILQKSKRGYVTCDRSVPETLEPSTAATTIDCYNCSHAFTRRSRGHKKQRCHGRKRRAARRRHNSARRRKAKSCHKKGRRHTIILLPRNRRASTRMREQPRKVKPKKMPKTKPRAVRRTKKTPTKNTENPPNKQPPTPNRGRSMSKSPARTNPNAEA